MLVLNPYSADEHESEAHPADQIHYCCPRLVAPDRNDPFDTGEFTESYDRRMTWVTSRSASGDMERGWHCMRCNKYVPYIVDTKINCRITSILARVSFVYGHAYKYGAGGVV